MIIREIIYTAKFNKSLKRVRNYKNFDKEVLEKIVFELASDIPLLPKYKDHKLSGDYIGSRECHLTSDILLIYRKDDKFITLEMLNIGSHSDLF